MHVHMHIHMHTHTHMHTRACKRMLRDVGVCRLALKLWRSLIRMGAL